MKKAAVLALALFLALPALSSAQQKDATGCKDHPLFTRMPDSWIQGCLERTFDAYEFTVAKGKKERVEGRFTRISYYPQAKLNPKPSELQILRNFENAVKALGGTSVYAEKSVETFRISREGKDFWVEVRAEFTGKYWLYIVETKAMGQDIVANADALADGLRTSGHVAVGGILFDTGKSTIKPESAQAIGEVAKLLKADPGLKLFVVGHTDTVGIVESNLTLAQDRAEAVLQSLVRDHGIAAARLRAFGCGPFAPVASNDGEDGRARNRRVELVKQ
jgi:outer membrane protein OmpA-like peptidoglycan-associated protein